MSIIDLRPGHDADMEDTPESAAIRQAVQDLPPSQQEAVHSRLYAVAANYERTGRVDPVLHFIESLLMTARLHRNPAYLKGLAEADADAASGPPQGYLDVEGFMHLMRDRYA